MADAQMEELDTAEENDDIPYVEFDISVSPSDPSLELLANQIEREDIIVPFYQRKYVWKIEQASRLIESFLMGLPVPQVFLYVNSEDKLEVIDGQQRLLSVKYFFEGYFGKVDASGRRRVFRLKGLSERSDYNGKTYDELPSRDQRRLRNATLRVINIKQLKPKMASDSVFHIFERLNTGGTQLKPQEIRNAVYRGPIVEWLWRRNDNADWRAIIGMKTPDKHQKDVELVLRLFSLYQDWGDYEKPMLSYLNRKMNEHKTLSAEKVQDFEAQFDRASDLVRKCIERPFRPKSVINSAVLESVMITLMEDRSISGDGLQERYERLLADREFQDLIVGATTDTQVLRRRLRRAREVLTDAA